MSKARLRIGSALLVVVSLLSACGGTDRKTSVADTEPTAIVAAPAITTPPTDAPTTVLETSTTVVETTVAETTVPETTVAPAAVRATLPLPVAVPLDSRGQEPIIEIGTIEIPKVGLKTTMYEGIRLTTLDRGPGHWPGTAMPGQVGNVVVAGHRTSHAKPFRNIDKLLPGDEVIFTTADGRFVYQVNSTEIVTPDAIGIIDQTAAKTATLFACHPPGSTRQRIVVHLTLVET
jgi:sortase A